MLKDFLAIEYLFQSKQAGVNTHYLHFFQIQLRLIFETNFFIDMNNNNDLYELAKKRKIEIVSAYGGKNLANYLDVSHPAISQWKVIPMLRAYQISYLGDFSLEYIRPDIVFKKLKILKKKNWFNQ